jgi:CBS domain containing-hemolysin-like protein
MFGEKAGWDLKVGVPLVLTLVLGEVVPKYIGLQNNLALSHWFAPSLNFFQNIMAPLRKWVVAVTTPISRVMFFFLRSEKEMTRDEIEHLIEHSEEQGLLNEEEKILIQGYLNFQDVQVKEIMWPREDILSYDLSEPLTKLIYLFVDQECTRVPLCDGSIDQVLGIINGNQFFLHQPSINSPLDLLPLLVKPFYIPETTPAKTLLRRLEETGEEMALVVDEYGTITGLLTKEDLIEVVVGEIKDLRDQPELLTIAGPGEVIASGKWELSEFNEYFDVELESPNNMVTLGGWLIEQMGEIPKSGAKYTSHGFLFQILNADPNRIRRIYVRKLDVKRKK